MKCHFDLEKTDKTDYYYPKSAPSVNGNRYSNVRCFYAPVGVFNKCQVYYTFWLQMTVADSVTLDITKLSISADGLDFPISEKPEMVGPGYKGDFTAGYSIDLRNHQKMAWALYYADYAKVVYESAGVKKEMLITAEELKYFRYSMDFYRSWIRCPKCVF